MIWRIQRQTYSHLRSRPLYKTSPSNYDDTDFLFPLVRVVLFSPAFETIRLLLVDLEARPYTLQHNL